VSTGVLTKLYPTRSHTGAAQGGVCAELGNFHVTEHPVLRLSTTIDLLVALSIPVNISLVP